MKSIDIFLNFLTIYRLFSRFLTFKKSIFFSLKLSTFYIFIKNSQNICFEKEYVNRMILYFFMWMKWITRLISGLLPYFEHFGMWITFLRFLKVWSFFFDKKNELCKLLIFTFSSTKFIHISYVENVDNRG
mgnify:CR=1 FL=1